MNETNKKLPKQHSLILENRQSLVLTGVCDVQGFDEQTINIMTDIGGLVVKGSKLHINKLSLDTGEVALDGTINSLQYISATQNKGFMSKIFK